MARFLPALFSLALLVNAVDLDLRPVGGYDTPGIAADVAVSGDHAYVADWTAGLEVFNIQDPTHPRLVGNFRETTTAQGVCVSGNYAYVATLGGITRRA